MRRVWRRLKLTEAMCKKTSVTDRQAENIIVSKHECFSPKLFFDNSIQKQYDLMIVIPVYNVERFLDECLQSVLNQQTRYTYHIVVVNDGSTDGSADILKQYETHSKITVIHQENKGLSGARNTALKEMNAAYVLFLDSDDTLPDHAIEALMSVALTKDADIVQGAYTKFNENGVIGTYDQVGEVTPLLPRQISGYACMKAIKAELLQDFCFPEGYLYEDTVMGKLLYPQCKCAYAVPQVVYNYRIHTQTISGAGQTNKNLDTYWITKYCLEEAVRRGYPMDVNMYEQYLQQCWVNFLRTQYLSQEIQEAMFVLTADLLQAHFKGVTCKGKFKLLDKALKRKSYAAYQFLMQRWELF